MSVYVDDMQAKFGGMIMCHMVADSSAELLAMADKIGVKRKWLQKPNTSQEHFDICQSKKKLAIKYGALEITFSQLGKFLIEKRNQQLNDKQTNSTAEKSNSADLHLRHRNGLARRID